MRTWALPRSQVSSRSAEVEDDCALGRPQGDHMLSANGPTAVARGRASQRGLGAPTHAAAGCLCIQEQRLQGTIWRCRP